MQSPERTLDAPDLVDDFYLNLLDWGSSNVLAIALGDTVYLWDASIGNTSELVTVNSEDGPVASISWAPDGCHIAIGLSNSDVQIWDCNNLQVSSNTNSNWFSTVIGYRRGFDVFLLLTSYNVTIQACTNIKRWPPITSKFPGLEQSHSYYWRNGCKNHQ